VPEPPPTEPLAFWIGTWTVTVDGEHAGDNTITRELDGNAVVERWHGASGVDGISLFWFDREAALWRQAWATNLGYAKDKRQVDAPAGSVRFEGPDRTTLTPLADGTVRQLIETRTDDGGWQPAFDAIYTRT